MMGGHGTLSMRSWCGTRWGRATGPADVSARVRRGIGLEQQLCGEDVHGSVEDPELLHHRAHRPRQVDSRGPDAAAHRRRRGARDARSVLDRMDIERERGITIKAQNVRLPWTVQNGRHDRRDRVHLIDNPGHVDFTYEVSRALEACEGAILLVDAAQASRRRPWPTCTWRWRRISHIIRCSTRSTCRPPTPSGTRPRSPTSSAARRGRAEGFREDRRRCEGVRSTRS